MGKIKALIRQYVFSEDVPLNARLVNLVYICGVATAVLTAICRFFIVRDTILNVLMLLLVVSPVFLMYISNRFRIHAITSWITIILLADIMFPLTLFALRSAASGMAAYFVMSVVIIFLLVDGKPLVGLLVSHVAVVLASYYVCFLMNRDVPPPDLGRQYLDAIYSFIICGLFVGAVLKFHSGLHKSERKKAQAALAALARRDELAHIVNKVTTILLTSNEDSFDDALQSGLALLARCMNVDLVHVWRNRLEGTRLYFREMYRWHENKSVNANDAELQEETSYDDVLPSWTPLLSAGECLNGPISVFSEKERAHLARFSLKSILAIPIFMREEFWGFISFDDCLRDRVFSSDDVEILGSGSLLLANTIVRNDMVREMREADARMKLLLDATPVCCNLWNEDLEVFDCNDAALRLFEVADKDTYMRDFFAYSMKYQPDGRLSDEAGRAYLEQAFIEGRVLFNWMHRTASGEGIPSEITLVRIERDNTRFLAAYTYDMRTYRKMTDSINLRLAQQEIMAEISQSFVSGKDTGDLIREALRKMGVFLDVTRVLIAVADSETEVSRPAYVWSTDEVVTDPTKVGFNDIIRNSFPKQIPTDGAIPTICCHDVQADERYHIFEIAGLKSFIWAPLYVEGVFWGMLSVEACTKPRVWDESDEQLVGMISSTIAGAVARDLFEREREKALDAAMKASKAKGDFLSNMSHEMRTPMNAIIGMTSIGKSAADIEKKNYAFGKIEDASTHLLGVINDILDMSKIEANKLELSITEFNFESMLQKVVNVVNFRVDEKKQNFHVDIDSAIPRTIIGDDQRLAQVITNLLSNAVKFTPDGGTIRLTSRLLEERDGLFTIRIAVTDSGIGISAEQQARLFTSFEQAESGTSRKFGGTGLGLAISKRIVEMMDGEIGIESELGKGATFAFTIQVRRGTKDDRRSLLAPGVNWKTIRILAVDDAPEVLEYFDRAAGQFGIVCDTAASGEAALERIRENGAYDIYFVDWRMPGMDGIELARHIRAHGPDTSVITMISATEWNVVEDEARAAGVDKYLAKPLFSSNIVNCINECLGANGFSDAPDAGSAVESFEGAHILLAEDVDINREIVLALLEPTRIEIDCAVNGAEALRMFGEAPARYDMIFMDVQMPEMDGYQATRAIRALDAPEAPVIPIVAMTANVFREDIERCLECGMNAHVGKPLDLDEVLAKLREFLPKDRDNRSNT